MVCEIEIWNNENRYINSLILLYTKIFYIELKLIKNYKNSLNC